MIRKFYLFYITFYLWCNYVSSQMIEDRCRTPKRELGTCINIKKCQALNSILKNRPITTDSRELLFRSQCGFEGKDTKVCCPSATQQTGVNLPPNMDRNFENNGSLPESTTTQKPDLSNRGDTDGEFSYYTEAPPNIEDHPNINLLPKSCGNVEDDRLIGGNKTGIFEFSWMALLSYEADNAKGSDFNCAGTIINSRYILTAAHCVTQLRRPLVQVRVGDHNYETEEDCEGINTSLVCAPPYQDIEIEEIIFHPQFIGRKNSGTRYQNDIGLLRLSKEIDMSQDNIAPICLPVNKKLQDTRLDGLNLMVTGWGLTETGHSSPELLKISLPIINNFECGRTLNKTITDGIGFRQVCANGGENVDSCQGDSGGPMKEYMTINGVLRYVQVGIVSFGARKCGGGRIPSVYTRVAYYMDWILDNMKP